MCSMKLKRLPRTSKHARVALPLLKCHGGHVQSLQLPLIGLLAAWPHPVPSDGLPQGKRNTASEFITATKVVPKVCFVIRCDCVAAWCVPQRTSLATLLCCETVQYAALHACISLSRHTFSLGAVSIIQSIHSCHAD